MDDSPISERFNDPTADLIVKSSDGTLFKVFRRDLAAYTGAFPPFTDLPSHKEVVLLPETSQVLDLLFQFARPQRPPDIEKIIFKILEPLAEAVEKYEVYSAIAICKVLMATKMRVFPLAVLAYAARHGYDDIRDGAAPLTVNLSFNVVRKRLDTNLLLAWVAYREEWIMLLRSAHQDHSFPFSHLSTYECCKWRLLCTRVLAELYLPSMFLRLKNSDSSIFEDLKCDEGITDIGCSECHEEAEDWFFQIRRNFMNTPTPIFKNFLI